MAAAAAGPHPRPLPRPRPSSPSPLLEQRQVPGHQGLAAAVGGAASSSFAAAFPFLPLPPCWNSVGFQVARVQRQRQQGRRWWRWRRWRRLLAFPRAVCCSPDVACWSSVTARGRCRDRRWVLGYASFHAFRCVGTFCVCWGFGRILLPHPYAGACWLGGMRNCSGRLGLISLLRMLFCHLCFPYTSSSLLRSWLQCGIAPSLQAPVIALGVGRGSPCTLCLAIVWLRARVFRGFL